jgi:hypothetical protein
MSEQINQPTGETTDHINVYAELKAEKEKAKQDREQAKREQAFKHYADYKSDYYKQTNQERVEAAEVPEHQKIKIDYFGDRQVIMIAQIKINSETGKVEDGHDYNPEAQSYKEIETAWQNYLATVPFEQRLVIYEGPPMDEQYFESRETAIRSSRRGDSGFLQFLARQSGVEAISAEVGDKEQAEILEKYGVTREESVLFFTLRSLAAVYDDRPVPEDLAMNFYFQLAEIGTPGFKIFSEEQKQYLWAHPEELAAEKAKVLPYVEQWNETLRSSGMPELVLDENDSLRFEQSITSNEVGKSIDAGGHTRLAEISRLNIMGRDRRIFETIADATKEGKRPFIVFGGSHVVSLEPVLQDYYGSMQSG